MIIRFLASHFEKNFNKYDQLLRSKQKCKSYSEFKVNAKSCTDSIFLIENYRSFQRRAFYEKYGLRERSIDLLLSFNAKLRFSLIRLIFDLTALYIQTFIISILIIFSRRILIVEAGLADRFCGIGLYPSSSSYLKNIHRPLLTSTSIEENVQLYRGSFNVTRDIFKKFRFTGILILLPVLILEISLYVRRRLNDNFIGLKCLGTMCIINRFYAVILKENGYVVHLEDHGIVRDCVAEYAIYTHASGYKGGTHPVSEDK